MLRLSTLNGLSLLPPHLQVYFCLHSYLCSSCRGRGFRLPSKGRFSMGLHYICFLLHLVGFPSRPSNFWAFFSPLVPFHQYINIFLLSILISLCFGVKLLQIPRDFLLSPSLPHAIHGHLASNPSFHWSFSKITSGFLLGVACRAFSVCGLKSLLSLRNCSLLCFVTPGFLQLSLSSFFMDSPPVFPLSTDIPWGF